MYDIFIGQDGKFYCHGRIQDGTERWEEDNLEAAVASMIQFARTINHDTITRVNIAFYRP